MWLTIVSVKTNGMWRSFSLELLPADERLLLFSKVWKIAFHCVGRCFLHLKYLLLDFFG